MKPRNFSLKIVLASVVALSACKSSSSTSPCNEKPPSGRVAAADLMLDCIDTLSPTSLASMPKTGSAVYNGYVSGTIDTSAATSDVLFADAQLNANFVGSSVTGTLSNFNSGNVGNMTGTVDITGGTIVGTGYTGATVASAGTLSYGADTVTLNGTSDGVFFGKKAKAVVGAIDGTSVLTSTGYNGTMALVLFGLK